MREYLKQHEWKIIEEDFNPADQLVSESVFSIGNGKMGQRANFEEEYSGETLLGSYVAGIYYPDKTRVGWWKNGYPEYFAKVLNAPSWIGIKIVVNGQSLDLAVCRHRAFRRELDMLRGTLNRKFVAIFPDGKELEIHTQRFCSMANGEVGAIRYAIKPLNFSGEISITLDVNADVRNEDSNYDEKFWSEVDRKSDDAQLSITAETRKTHFRVCTGISYDLRNRNNEEVSVKSAQLKEREKYAGRELQVDVARDNELVIYKYGSVVSSMNHVNDVLVDVCKTNLRQAKEKGFDALLADHEAVWAHKWSECDITIDGDIAAQQGIRFNIFQLTQTYTGEDDRLNIGPKGFTGEKYGGSTYWDTEAYCIPFFLSTSDQHVARNLLIYRHKHLPKAIENAEKLGFRNGAALYPMVTMNGEECHNEWEITFEEIHRNGAIAYAIYDYVRYTGDEEYLVEYGLEVLISISRFWSQRVNWSESKQKFVILGVTGPNEYENNVNNNWYTNYIAVWTLRYTRDAVTFVKQRNSAAYTKINEKLNFSDMEEIANWERVIDGMYYPVDEQLQVFLQQDGFLDKQLLTVNDLGANDRPINQKWSWDRILRSCFIKQADVLQGMYFFEDDFSLEQHRRNFDFYEPMTVHESSLSPCVHVILAAKLGYERKAYELYLRTSRLDLDNYNNDTEDGCHITSMAGTWMSVVKGFGGMRVRDGQLSFKPFIPKEWNSYSFRIEFRGRVLRIRVGQLAVEAFLESGAPISIMVNGKPILVETSVVLKEVV